MIVLTPDNKSLLVGGKVLTFGASPVVIDPVEPTPGAAMPTASAAGWWDASALSWGSAVSTLTDKTTAGKNATTSAKAIPRLAGSLGGLYSEGNTSNYTVLHPVINDYSVGASGVAVGTGQAFTVMLTWSRPNQRQPGGVLSSAPVQLLAINGTSVITLSAVGNGADVLTLFPDGAAITAGLLELRHTHSLRVVFAGSTVDVWLDGAKVISAAANTLNLGATASLSFLNAAQCIFHEAAAWAKTLTASENADLSGYLARWPLGPRRAVNGIAIGQSNMDNLLSSFILWPLINKAVAYLTGCIASNLLWRSGGLGNVSAGNMVFSGQTLYDTSGNLFLNSSSGSANVATWPLGANGNNYMTALDALSADHKANLRYMFFYWSETISAAVTYANKAVLLGAMKRTFQLIRARVGLTAAQLPIMMIDPLPFSSTEGSQTYREVVADLIADASQNCVLMLAQSGDAIGQNDTWNSSTGVEGPPASGGTVGNSAHRDYNDILNYNRRWSAPIARATVAANAAAGTLDVVKAIDASIPVTCGPRIVSAQYETGATVLVTVAHDGGSDLAIPLRAALGVGWAVMDGVNETTSGTPGTPGAVILATTCARVNATQLRITLSSSVAYPSKAKLFYNYGNGLDTNAFAIIGRGNAVTDNFASATLSAGWRIGVDRGAAEQPNNPLQSTLYGVALS